MIATAVFQTAIITLGAKSQKVQAREHKYIFNLSLILAGLLNAGVPARCPTATGWDFSGTPVDFPFPPSLCDLHISNHLYLHTPHQAITSDMFLIMFPAIRHNDKRPIPQGNIAKAKVGKIIDVWNPHFFLYGIRKRNYIQTHPSPNVLQGIRQRNRTNLLTAKQSLNLLLITTICGGGSTFVNVIYPAIKGQKPEIMWVSDSIRCLDIFISSCFFLVRILVQAFLTLAGILVETGETYYSCLENDL